ncbi:MAG: anti-anti-sigma factor [Epulopiscium sp. Nele67-Bin004]|nr:MAG: anti-anti-sigma factor [Epulopiscium sp. Nele67-Bin004]
MNIKTEIKNNVLFVYLEGEIDHHTSVEIKEIVDRLYASNRLTHILFDFEDVTFMDSSGVGLLIGRYRNAMIGGGKVALIKVKPEIDKLMNLSGIYKLMKKYEDEQNAVANL